MLVLFETAAGYAIFKLLNDKKLAESDNLYLDFQSPETASKLLNLKYFHKFEDINEALVAVTASIEGKLCKSLKKTLKKHCVELHEELAVADTKLGNVIKDKLGLACVCNTSVQELMRCIRSQMDGLLAGVKMKDMTAMRLGLAHNLSRYKLKFSPDKVDIMVTQAIKLLDELDKELNNYIMRCREWYGIHFPELGKIISDNMTYVRTVQVIGMRDNVANSDLSDVIPENVEKEVKVAAEFSMGTEMSEEDIICTHDLCTEIIELSQSRTQLHDYLKVRMMALAPNLSVLVGELIGARLMSHAGSLINLAKHPASTVQILGAEKALFRALKTKKNTPKYGLIYHSQLVGQSSKKIKGKMSRMLAAKASLATRFDALGESTNFDLGTEHRANLEARLRMLEEKNICRISGTAKAKAKFEKYHTKSDYFQYSASVDSTLQKSSADSIKQEDKPLIEEIYTQQEDDETHKKRKKVKKENVADSTLEADSTLDTASQEDMQSKTEPDTAPKKKKKKKRKNTDDIAVETGTASQEDMQVKVEQDIVPKKKKKKKENTDDRAVETGVTSQEDVQTKTESDAVPKKKKKRSLPETTGEPSVVQEGAHAETDPEPVPKKKKKRKVTMEETMEVPNTEPIRKKTKKRKDSLKS